MLRNVFQRPARSEMRTRAPRGRWQRHPAARSKSNAMRSSGGQVARCVVIAMQCVVLAFAAVTMPVGCGAGSAEQREGASMRATFGVQGMVCDSCSHAIGQALLAVPGVERAIADHELGAAAVEYDPAQTDPAELEKVIERLGYQADLRGNDAVRKLGPWENALRNPGEAGSDAIGGAAAGPAAPAS